jgi:putative aldouronate transport system permease protein
MKIKKTPAQITFNIIGYTLVTLMAAYCLFPLWMIVAGSFEYNDVLVREGYNFWPRQPTGSAYVKLLEYPERILIAYSNTIVVTIIGTLVGLIIITMTGYVLQRPDFKYRNTFSFLIYFTTIFSGGLVPWFMILSKYMGFYNTWMARIFPLLVTPFLIILMRTFISSTVPHEIVESAKIDSAGDFAIYCRIVLPILGPGIATVGLFLALGYWNDWFNTSLFITNRDMYSLQFFLYDMLQSARFANDLGIPQQGGEAVPTESLKMATVVVVTGPIILLYPFVQRYFVTGITVGSVKG